MTADLRAPASGVTGITERVAAETLSGHRAVAFLPDGSVTYADNDSLFVARLALGITVSAALAGDEVGIAMVGVIVNEPSWSWIAGGPIFLGVQGALTQTAPTADDAEVLVLLGVAISPTSMYIDPQPPIVL